MSKARGPYEGSTKKLLVAVDIGTTFTAVSFALLEPGRVPDFKQITRWPKQAIDDFKVSSEVLYDKRGQAQAFGAETDDIDIGFEAETNGWVRATWWKLHLRPAHLSMIKGLELRKIPESVTTVDKIFEHFLAYVKTQLQDHISKGYGGGDTIWSTLFPTMELVLTAPNGWEISQQQRMRAAALRSGIVAHFKGEKRVHFVSEAEAAVLYALGSGCISEWVSMNAELIVCDCGGGTIDIAQYVITGLSPLELKETAAATCYCAGAVFVTTAFEVYITKLFKGTRYDNPVAIERAVNNFEFNAKRTFAGIRNACWVELGGFESDTSLGIRNGKLRISGDTMATFFDRSLKQIKEGLDVAHRTTESRAKNIILVGGLCSSPYVFAELEAWGRGRDICVSRPDGLGAIGKAVANGALAWYLQDSVTARVSKFHYGTDGCIPFDSSSAEHTSRPAFVDISGEKRVANAWSCIVNKGVSIDGGHEFTRSYSYLMRLDETNTRRSSDILAYRLDQPGRFVTHAGSSFRKYPGFERLCTVEADLRAPYEAAPLCLGSTGTLFKKVHVDICLSFGGTEWTARICWEEKGMSKYGTAAVVAAPEANE